MSLVTLSEPEIRKLRDKVFDHTINDAGWNNCRENWEHDLEWLVNASNGVVPKEKQEYANSGVKPKYKDKPRRASDGPEPATV